MTSKITGGPVDYLFSAKILSKYDVKYFKCRESGFIQTEPPHWLEEAYQSAIVSLDVGLAQRNEEIASITKKIFARYFPDGKKYLDYGGGYGQYVRMMRDRGYNFYLYDAYAENLYARFFEIKDIEKCKAREFEVVTAFEVFEHLENPLQIIEKLFTMSDSILFSTEVVPDKMVAAEKDWWYFVPETGQHIAFYTMRSLQIIADRFGATLYSNKVNMHLLTKKTFKTDPFVYLKSFKRFRKIGNIFKKLPYIYWNIKKRKSLMLDDFDMISGILKNTTNHPKPR